MTLIGALLQTTNNTNTSYHHRPNVGGGVFPPTRAVLQWLGMWQPMDEILLMTMATASSSTTTTISTTAPLTPSKESFQNDDDTHHNTITGSSKRRRRRTRVHFDELTYPPTIHTIPSHETFTAQERRDTWRDSAEIAMMVHRNRREFSSEGWDWRNVKEEDEMYFDLTTHTYIHPVHLGGRLIS